MLSTQGEYKREKERERDEDRCGCCETGDMKYMNKFWRRVKYEISPQSIKYEMWEKATGNMKSEKKKQIWNMKKSKNKKYEIWKKKCQKKNEKYEKKKK